MRYRLSKDIVIRTENAAKARSQQSRFLIELIGGLHNVDSSFDFGCGKLRYAREILRTTNTLTLVDSDIQLSRTQQLGKREVSIRQIAKASNSMRAMTAAEFSSISAAYDRGFCVNVLSVIPRLAWRKRVVELIHSRLKRGGECLFVVQYRNSDFSRMRGLPNARDWLDGFLIDSLRGFSFYGLISPDKLRQLLTDAGFEIASERWNEGSAYLLGLAGPPKYARVGVISESPAFSIV